MPTLPESLSGISDVGYLLILLRIARKNKDNNTKEAVLCRLRDMGVLKGEGIEKQNLRAQIDRILGSHCLLGMESQDGRLVRDGAES